MAYSQLSNSVEPGIKPAVVVSATNSSSRKQELKKHSYRKRLLGFAIVEILLGIACKGLGVTLLVVLGRTSRFYEYFDYSNDGYDNYRNYHYIHVVTLGEGIWCGIWVIVAGVLGVFCSRPRASYCTMVCHMIFSIIGAIFSGIMLIIAAIGSYAGGKLATELGIIHVVCLYCFLAVSALASMIMLILSASYTCALLGWCEKDFSPTGCCCCTPYESGGQAMLNLQPRLGNNGIMLNYQQLQLQQQQQQAFMAHPQQQMIGNQGLVYSQQATMPYEGMQNIKQTAAVQATQPIPVAAVEQGSQPTFEQRIAAVAQASSNQTIQKTENVAAQPTTNE